MMGLIWRAAKYLESIPFRSLLQDAVTFCRKILRSEMNNVFVRPRMRHGFITTISLRDGSRLPQCCRCVQRRLSTPCSSLKTFPLPCIPFAKPLHHSRLRLDNGNP
ncbi:hypothetical protein BDZ89DRAFT_357129 [Hymenopellis radicata]|nr:hypothetical protein BDZ89DRAFT_357129 [Hymenopellis radicata]